MTSLPSKVAEYDRYGFRLVTSSGVRVVGPEELDEFAWLVGLKRIIDGRFSRQFVMDLLKMLEVDCVNPAYVVTEIKQLEHGSKSRTKAAEEFKHPPLKGLWHKHFLAAQFLPANIKIEHGKKGGEKIITRKNLSMRAGNDVGALSGEVSHEVVISAVEQYSARRALTAEWIVFAKHDGKNYYLRTCNHSNANSDQLLYDEIEMLSFRQFPFLKKAIAPPDL